MELKFKHEWTPDGADNLVCTTTLLTCRQRIISKSVFNAHNIERFDIKKVVEKTNEENLTMEIYGMPRREFFEELTEVKRLWCPMGKKAHAPMRRLTNLVYQLPAEEKLPKQLQNKNSLVLFFANNEDRNEFLVLVKEYKMAQKVKL